jgi:hypothetical protein
MSPSLERGRFAFYLLDLVQCAPGEVGEAPLAIEVTNESLMLSRIVSLRLFASRSASSARLRSVMSWV